MNRNRGWLLVLTLGTLLLLLLIVTDWWPLLRGPAPETAEWYWPYQLRPLARWLKPVLAILLLVGVSGWWLRLPGGGRSEKAGLCLLLAASFLLQLALMNADNPNIRDELINRAYSNLSSGYFQAAVALEDLGEALRNYPALMPDFPSEHAQTHPPGLVIANRLTLHLFERFPSLANKLAPPAIAARCIDLWLLERSTAVAATLVAWAIIPLLAAALTVLPAYWLARLMLPQTAVKLAALLVATLPALLLFAPKSVQLYPPLTLLILGTFYSGLLRWSWPRFLLSGFLLSLASFLSLGNTALGLLLLIFAALHLRQHPLTPSPSHPLTSSPPHLLTLSKPLLAFTLGAASLWLLYWLGWGVAPWQIAQVGLGQHYELVTRLRRYDWWLLWNLIDVIVFAGWVVVAGFTAVTIHALKNSRRRDLAPAHLLALSTAAVLLILNLSGSARGEVGRIWMFFMPLLALAAAQFLVEIAPSWRRQWGMIAMQLLLTLALALAWRPVRAVAVIAQKPISVATSAQHELIHVFAETIHLNGYTIEVNENTLELALFWQAAGQALRPYTVFNQLIDEQGQVVAQKDNWPGAGQWPPTCWAPGEAVVDVYTISLPPDLPDGRYTLITGWYDAADGERLVTAVGQDFVPLGDLIRSGDSLTWGGNTE